MGLLAHSLQKKNWSRQATEQDYFSIFLMSFSVWSEKCYLTVEFILEVTGGKVAIKTIYVFHPTNNDSNTDNPRITSYTCSSVAVAGVDSRLQDYKREE